MHCTYLMNSKTTGLDVEHKIDLNNLETAELIKWVKDIYEYVKLITDQETCLQATSYSGTRLLQQKDV